MPLSRRLSRLLGIGLLTLLLLIGAVVARRQLPAFAPQTGQTPPTEVDQVAELPILDSPLPTVIIEGTIFPTETPLPTSTPRPTPTLRPGPTFTPYPTHAPEQDASGTIFYTSQDASQVNIYSFAVDGQGMKIEEPKRLSVDANPILGSPSPDGHYVVWLKPVFPVGIPYIFDRHTQESWPIFRKQPEYEQITGIEFGWHPDSRQLLFWFFGNEELWLVDVETGNHTVLAFTYGPPQGAAISPDGQTVVFGNHSNSGDDGIWVVDSFGSEVRLLLDLQASAYVFGWSPDGKNILYMGGSGQNADIQTISDEKFGSPLWIMAVDGQNSRNLSGPFLSGWGFEPKWSPDSQWIVYTGLEKGDEFGCAKQNPAPDWKQCQYEGAWVYMENIETGESRKLAMGIHPSWSPDSKIVSFLSNQSGTPEIWTMSVADNSLFQLTNDDLLKSTFIWASGGK